MFKEITSKFNQLISRTSEVRHIGTESQNKVDRERDVSIQAITIINYDSDYDNIIPPIPTESSSDHLCKADPSNNSSKRSSQSSFSSKEVTDKKKEQLLWSQRGTDKPEQATEIADYQKSYRRAARIRSFDREIEHQQERISPATNSESSDEDLGPNIQEVFTKTHSTFNGKEETESNRVAVIKPYDSYGNTIVKMCSELGSEDESKYIYKMDQRDSDHGSSVSPTTIREETNNQETNLQRMKADVGVRGKATEESTRNGRDREVSSRQAYEQEMQHWALSQLVTTNDKCAEKNPKSKQYHHKQQRLELPPQTTAKSTRFSPSKFNSSRSELGANVQLVTETTTTKPTLAEVRQTAVSVCSREEQLSLKMVFEEMMRTAAEGTVKDKTACALKTTHQAMAVEEFYKEEDQRQEGKNEDNNCRKEIELIDYKGVRNEAEYKEQLEHTRKLWGQQPAYEKESAVILETTLRKEGKMLEVKRPAHEKMNLEYEKQDELRKQDTNHWQLIATAGNGESRWKKLREMHLLEIKKAQEDQQPTQPIISDKEAKPDCRDERELPDLINQGVVKQPRKTKYESGEVVDVEQKYERTKDPTGVSRDIDGRIVGRNPATIESPLSGVLPRGNLCPSITLDTKPDKKNDSCNDGNNYPTKSKTNRRVKKIEQEQQNKREGEIKREQVIRQERKQEAGEEEETQLIKVFTAAITQSEEEYSNDSWDEVPLSEKVCSQESAAVQIDKTGITEVDNNRTWNKHKRKERKATFTIKNRKICYMIENRGPMTLSTIKDCDVIENRSLKQDDDKTTSSSVDNEIEKVQTAAKNQGNENYLFELQQKRDKAVASSHETSKQETAENAEITDEEYYIRVQIVKTKVRHATKKEEPASEIEALKAALNPKLAMEIHWEFEHTKFIAQKEKLSQQEEQLHKERRQLATERIKWEADILAQRLRTATEESIKKHASELQEDMQKHILDKERLRLQYDRLLIEEKAKYDRLLMEETIRAEQRLQQAKETELKEENKNLRKEKEEITKFLKDSQQELRKLTEDLLEIKLIQTKMVKSTTEPDQLQVKNQRHKYEDSLLTQRADKVGLKDVQRLLGSKSTKTSKMQRVHQNSARIERDWQDSENLEAFYDSSESFESSGEEHDDFERDTIILHQRYQNKEEPLSDHRKHVTDKCTQKRSLGQEKARTTQMHQQQTNNEWDKRLKRPQEDCARTLIKELEILKESHEGMLMVLQEREKTIEEQLHQTKAAQERTTIEEPSVNGYFPDPLPEYMNGISPLLDGEGFHTMEVWTPPTKFDNNMTTVSQWWNDFYEGAISHGFSHRAILAKMRGGSLLGDRAKIRQSYYVQHNISAFKIKESTKEEVARNVTKALAEWLEWFCKTFYIKHNREKVMQAINEMSLQSFDSKNAKGDFDLSNASDLYHAMWEKMQELEPEERTNKRFLVNLRDAIQRSSIKIGEEMDEKVAEMVKLQEYQGLEEKHVYLVYLDQASAKARRYFLQEKSFELCQQSLKQKNLKEQADAEDQHNNVTKIINHLCEVCGCNTHQHKDCQIRWKEKSTSKRPEIDRYEMAKLSSGEFDKMWEQVCKKGCLKQRTVESRLKLKNNILNQRKTNIAPT